MILWKKFCRFFTTHKEPIMPKILPLNLMSVNYVESPNKSDGKIDNLFIVLHHTGPGSFGGMVNWLTNPQAKASAHYVLGLNGELTQLVNTKRVAWHAGVSKWGQYKNLNQYSIGIELCNYGLLNKDGDEFYYEVGRDLKKYTGSTKPIEGSIIINGVELKGHYIPYTEEQINKLIALIKALIIKYPQITKNNILTHYQIAQPPGRKNDPFGLDINNIINRVFYE